MTPKERIQRVLNGQKVDHLPSQIDFTPAAARALVAHLGIPDSQLPVQVKNHILECYSLGSVEEYLQDPPALNKAVELGLAHFAEGDHLVYDDWGVGWDLIPDGGWPAVHPLADLSAYPAYIFPTADNSHIMDNVRAVIRESGDYYFIVAAHHTALFERAWALRGFEEHLTDFYYRLDFVEELYDRITEFQVELAWQFIAAGVHGVVVGDDYGTQHGLIMSPGLWRQVIKPRLQRIWRTYQEAGVPVILHTCGDVRPILGDFIEMGLDCLHPIQPLAMPIKDIVNTCGNHLCYFGGIDTQQLLPFGSAQQVQNETRAAIETLGKYRRYIIAPAQAIMPDVPIANLVTLLNTIQQYC